MTPTNVHFEWRNRRVAGRFRTAVSLHSHTLCSKENLSFIPRVSARIPLLALEVRRQNEMYRRVHGHYLDFSKVWWTPPLTPHGAWDVELNQIEQSCRMAALISLTDHDSIEGPCLLQATRADLVVPMSVEWTVPFGRSFFHLGVHNLPAETAAGMMRQLAGFTADPQPQRLGELLEHLHSIPSVLVVWNHPMWDESGIGTEEHDATVREFAAIHGPWVHALELNGLRSWDENKRVIALAESMSLPVISGGDRHCLEPNACLNLTAAETFPEFVQEIRAGLSEVLFRPQYRRSLTWRLMRHLGEILREHPNHGYGWRRWCDRIFYEHTDGTVQSLAEIWGGGGPLVIQSFVGLTVFVCQSRLQAEEVL